MSGDCVDSVVGWVVVRADVGVCFVRIWSDGQVCLAWGMLFVVVLGGFVSYPILQAKPSTHHMCA
jgi:hypothetical protein